MRRLATGIFCSILVLLGGHSFSAVALLPSALPDVTIQIIAAGNTNEERVELEIDGTIVAVFENLGGDAYAGQFVTLDYSAPIANPINVLRVRFTNDLFIEGFDRTVRIDAVIINGQRFETEAPSVFSSGSWRELDGCAPAYKESEFLDCNGFFSFSVGEVLGPIAGTFGEGTITDAATSIQFESAVSNPVIIASVPTFNESHAGTIGIDNVSNAGFDIRFREWEYLDQIHAEENVEWLALEQGVYGTADGSIWEVATFGAFDNNNFISKSFAHDFAEPPIVFATVQSANGPPVAIRIRNVTAEGFECAIFEEEAQLTSSHPLEIVGYLAIAPGANSGIVTIDNRVFPYLFEEFRIGSRRFALRSLISAAGALSQAVPQTPINSRLSIRLQEENSLDRETFHGREVVAVMTLGSKVYAQDQTFRQPDPFTFRSIRSDTAISLPTGFEFTEVLDEDAFEDAVAMEIDDAGRIFVAQENGVIWLVENGVKNPVPYLDISGIVANQIADDGGFSGFVLDPDFSNNGFFYVMYTTEVEGQEFGRVERYQQSAGNPNLADSNSSFILMGNDASDGLRKKTFHNVGDLEFGADGSLILSWGDTASNDADDPDHFLAQDINTPAGKMFRIDPATGFGYATNPFFTGTLQDIASKVWVLGVRNGFRIARIPGTGSVSHPGTFIVAEVGRDDFDEVNLVLGGENLGWPYFEANQRFRLGGDDLTLTPPIIAYPHPATRSVIGGAFYEGSQWPASYQGQYFISDFVVGWMRSYVVESDGSLTESDFGLEVKGMTDMKFDPSSGKMYLIGRGRDILFDEGEGLDGLYSITYVGQ